VKEREGRERGNALLIIINFTVVIIMRTEDSVMPPPRHSSLQFTTEEIAKACRRERRGEREAVATRIGSRSLAH
jgi:hypothetical protein